MKFFNVNEHMFAYHACKIAKNDYIFFFFFNIL